MWLKALIHTPPHPLPRVFLSRDRSVTLVNVLGDAMGTGIVQHLSRDDLASLMKDEATAFDQSENNPEQLLSSGV